MNSKVQEALEQLHRELERLAPAVNHIEAAQEVTSYVAKLPELFREDAVLSEERYSAAIHLYQQQLDYHAAELSQALEKFQQESGELTSAMSEEGKQLTELRGRIEEYQKKIAAIDFPTRLDKLDATVSGIMAATQTTQGRVDNLESRTSEKLAALSTSIDKLESTTSEKLSALLASVENQQKALTASIEKANKSTRTLLIVSIVLSVLLIAAVAYLFTRT